MFESVFEAVTASHKGILGTSDMDLDTDKDKVRNSDTSLPEYVSELSDKFDGHLTGTLFLPSRHQIPLIRTIENHRIISRLMQHL